MPKSTFFRLPQAKQDRLMKAAYQEFSRAPFNEASVSNIIKTAGIPRGSFYQYFEDKEDIFLYNLSLFKETSASNLEQALIDADGDLFQAIRAFFNGMVQDVLLGDNAMFYRHIFLHTDYKNRRKISPELRHPHQGEMLKFIDEHIDYTHLSINREQPEELKILFHQLMTNVFQEIAAYYLYQETPQARTIEDVEQRFALITGWLEHGVAKADDRTERRN